MHHGAHHVVADLKQTWRICGDRRLSLDVVDYRGKQTGWILFTDLNSNPTTIANAIFSFSMASRDFTLSNSTNAKNGPLFTEINTR